MQKFLATYSVLFLVLLLMPSQAIAALEPGEKGGVKTDSYGRKVGGAERPRHVADEIVFQFKDQEPVIKVQTVTAAKVERKLRRDALRQDITRRHKLRDTRKLYRNPRKEKLELVTNARVPSGTSVAEALAELQADPDIEWAEPNYLRYAQTTPNDPQYPVKQNAVFTSINIPAAWDVTTGNSDVVVAVIDSGVDWSHPDLADNIWTNTGEIDGDLIDNDGNGFDDDVRGWDFVAVSEELVFPGEDYASSDNNPMDFHGHGTHVSGIVGAKGNNGIGISGVNWDVRIMPVRAGYKDTSGMSVFPVTAIGEALIYACDNGADIINMSFGAPSPSITESQALEYCDEMGVILVAAAGNSSSTDALFPAGFPQVLSVASVDSANNRSYFSNYGPGIDVAAPGENIYSTLVGGGYGPMTGTSMASPVIAGVAALVKAANPGWTKDQIYTQLRSTAADINLQNPADINLLGGGLVQAEQALAGLNPSPRMGTIAYFIEEIPPGGEDGNMAGGESFTIRPTIRNFGTRKSDIQVVFESSDPYLNITDNLVTIDTLGAGERATEGVDVFEFSVSTGAPDNYYADVDFVITQGGSPVQTDRFRIHLNPAVSSTVVLVDDETEPVFVDSRIFVNSDDSLTVLYRRTGIQVSNILFSRHRTPQGNWEPEVTIPNVSGFGNMGSYDAVVDSQDRLHVVFQANEGEWDNELVYVVRDPAGGNWLTPLRLTPDASPYVSGHNSVNPAIAVDADDNPQVVWADYRSGASEIYTMTFAGSIWAQETVVTSFAEDVQYLDFFIDRNNNRTLLWGDGANGVSLMRNPGTGWQQPENVVSDRSYASADLDPSGKIHIIYDSYFDGDIVYRNYDGSILSVPDVVDEMDLYIGYLGVIKADRNGGLHIIHKDQPDWPSGVPLVYEIEHDGVGWQPMVPILSGQESAPLAGDIDIACTGAGQRFVAGISSYTDYDILFYTFDSADESFFPDRPLVVDAGDLTVDPDQLSVSFSSAHTSGIATSYYAAGTYLGGNDLVAWTAATSQNFIFALPYSMQYGQSYYISVVSEANNGYRSMTGVSDGIRLDCVGGDSDNDGVCDLLDICPGGDDTLDSDSDGIPDFCDICPDEYPNDSDGDGICNSSDICPGYNDVIDTDGDGVPDGCDAFPNDAAASIDSDGDLFPDAWNFGKTAEDSTTNLTLDAFPADPTEHADTDGDGFGDNSDACPDNMPIHIVDGGNYWEGLQWVYDYNMQSGDTVQTQSSFGNGPLVLNQMKDVTIQGGFNCGFTDNAGAATKIESLTLDSLSGSVTVENIVIE